MESPAREKFKKEIEPKLRKDLGLKNNFAGPKPVRAILQIGVGKMVIQSAENKEKILTEAGFVLNQISGQKPALVKAKKSVAGFKLREGQPVALMATLRRGRLFDLIDRLTTYVLPRIRDFRGLTEKNFDRDGNINLGFREVSIFPEAISDKIRMNFGLQITIIGKSKNKEEKIKLWQSLGFPIKN
ncbi:MAG: 50S ribosomal protein L5 [Patescibacteria group bacterium]|nr:50S ribosomal protein L5 [Patescibacteria group bacterium]